MNWKDRHVHLAAILIVWPIIVLAVFAVLAIIGIARGFALDNIIFGIGERAGLIATGTTAAWIARQKGRGIAIALLSFIVPLYAFVLRNKKCEVQ